MIYPYKFETKEDIAKLCELACKKDFPVYISTALGQIDARSLLGLFTIMGKEVNLVAPDHLCAKEFSKFIAELEGL